jgi:hypothetical protein
MGEAAFCMHGLRKRYVPCSRILPASSTTTLSLVVSISMIQLHARGKEKRTSA